MATAQQRAGRFALLGILTAIAVGAATLVPAQPRSNQPPANQPPRSKAPAALRPILKTGELMAQFNAPRYKQLKQALASKNADPKAVQATALEVAEIANLIAIRRPPRGGEAEWEKFALGVQQAALGLAEAAGGGQTVAAAGGLIQACNNCHQRFAPESAPMLK